MECSRLRPAVRGQRRRPDPGAALPRQHPALLPGQAARDHERHRPGLAQADRGRAAAARRRSPTRSGSPSSGPGWPRRATRSPAPRSARGIAREIHDTLAQGLTAIALHIEGALQPPRDAARAGPRAAGPGAGDHPREPGRGAALGARPARPRRWPGKPLAEALAALARAFTSETRRAGPRASRTAIDPAAARRGRAVPDRPGGAGQRPPARARAPRSRSRCRRRGGRWSACAIRDDGVGFRPRAGGRAEPNGIGLRDARAGPAARRAAARSESRPGHGHDDQWHACRSADGRTARVIRVAGRRRPPDRAPGAGRGARRRGRISTSSARPARPRRRSRWSPRLRPDVVLLDLELPGLDGVEAIPRLLRGQPGRWRARLHRLRHRRARARRGPGGREGLPAEGRQRRARSRAAIRAVARRRLVPRAARRGEADGRGALAATGPAAC